MGWGDEIIASAQARALWATDGRPVTILDRRGEVRNHPAWRDLVFIKSSAPGYRARYHTITNGPGARPYVDYRRTTKERWAYTDFSVNTAGPGSLRLEASHKNGAVVIEPNIKPNASPNKQWGHWQQLVDRSSATNWVQLGPRGTPILEGARHVETSSFLDACKYLAGATAAILPEGGLHHAAAALSVPAVVIFGAMTSPKNTGYKAHKNLYVDDPDSLGWRIPMRGCKAAMDSITARDVFIELESICK